MSHSKSDHLFTMGLGHLQEHAHHWEASISALLFAAMPVHTEAVAGIVGQADILSALLAGSAFLVYCKAARSMYVADSTLLSIAEALVAAQISQNISKISTWHTESAHGSGRLIYSMNFQVYSCILGVWKHGRQ